jgi:hypothetical protein
MLILKRARGSPRLSYPSEIKSKILKLNTMKTISSKMKFLAMAGITVVAGAFIQSCSKSSSGGTPPPTPIDGYVSSDSVAPANLVSYFNFDGTVNDGKGNSGTAVGVTYVAGVRGQAYQGAAGAYATVPASAAFATLTSYSVTCWYSLPTAAKPQPGGTAQGIFFLSGDSSGNIDGNEIILETDVPSTSQLAADSVPVHHGFNNIGGAAGTWQNFTMNSFDTATSNWVFVAMTYDGPSSTYTFYENGAPISVSSAYGVSTSTIILNGPTPSPIQGPLNLNLHLPQTLIIGTWPPGLYGVSPTLGSKGCFLGAIDELRVFNRQLTQLEVAGLYGNGLAGR